jgi:hypothetical protein
MSALEQSDDSDGEETLVRHTYRREKAARSEKAARRQAPDDVDEGKQWTSRLVPAASLGNLFNGDTVEHRDLHKQTGETEPLYGSVIGATVYAGVSPGSEDENRLIMQSTDGSTRLVEVNHMRQFGAVSDHPQPTHNHTQLWVPPSSVTPQGQHLVVAQAHLKMVAHYLDMLVAAMAQHHETTDQWSFECDPLTGAMTCAATMPPMGDIDAAGDTNRFPSSLNDEDSRLDPLLEWWRYAFSQLNKPCLTSGGRRQGVPAQQCCQAQKA